MTPRNDRPILAIDPGLRELGYAVLAGKKILAAGVLPLRTTPKNLRLGKVRDSMTSWIRAYRPRSLVLEHVPRRALDTLAGLPALGRLLKRLATRRRLSVTAYSAKAVRRSVVGDGWAGKRETAEAVCARFPELKVQLTQDRKWKERHWQNMFDAVALALHHQLQTKPPSRSR